MTGAASADMTLGDYYARKMRDEAFSQNKLTFDEWLRRRFPIVEMREEYQEILAVCWKAAQENV